MTFCDMLVHVQVAASSRWCRKLVYTCTFLHQSTNSVVRVQVWTVWRTQICRDKIRCFLLKELDCFTSIEWRRNASFLLQLF